MITCHTHQFRKEAKMSNSFVSLEVEQKRYFILQVVGIMGTSALANALSLSCKAEDKHSHCGHFVPPVAHA